MTYGGMDFLLDVLLISVLDGGEWSASRPGHLSHLDRIPNRFYSINQKDNETEINPGKGVAAYTTKCDHPK
jgi:hypothetical protein